MLYAELGLLLSGLQRRLRLMRKEKPLLIFLRIMQTY